MTPRAKGQGPARTLRRRAAGVGLVILGAMLGLIGGGLWLNARRKAPSRAASPFTLGADARPEDMAEHAAPVDARRSTLH